ncbi:MAG: hypothetical protein ACHQ50_11360 [Fimbriimonadales bacterium]
MGTFLPDFYRATLPGAENYSPVQMGIGLGFSEGLALGFLVGVLIVCVLAFGKRCPSG